MPEIRKRYDREFREGAVRIVEETGKPIAQVARDLGVNEGTLATGVCHQGPCKVSFARSELRFWRPAAGIGPPESRLCPRPAWSALGSCPGQSDLVVDLTPRRPRLDTESQPLYAGIWAGQPPV